MTLATLQSVSQSPKTLFGWITSLVAIVALLNVTDSQASVVKANDNNKVVLLATHPQKNTETHSSRQSTNGLNRLMKCIFDHVERDYDVYYIPWARAKRELSRSAIDGIFLTNLEENVAGIKTKPIYLEKWFALSHIDTITALSDYRIGVIRDSDVAHWLTQKGISAHIMANNYEQLLDQFSANRFDLFIADINLLKRAEGARELVDGLNKQFVRYMAKGLTFSEAFVDANPALLRDFNASITTCNPAISEVNSVESRTLRRYVDDQITPQLPHSLLASAVAVQSGIAELRQPEILSLDREWRNAFKQQTMTPFMQTLLANPVSQQLRELSENVSAVGEIFLTDSNGTLLGSSALLSDYYQGDEEKVTTLTDRSWSLTDIRYDESTGNFISHYSTRMQTQEGDTFILIIGLNLEEVFRGEDISPGTLSTAR